MQVTRIALSIFAVCFLATGFLPAQDLALVVREQTLSGWFDWDRLNVVTIEPSDTELSLCATAAEDVTVKEAGTSMESVREAIHTSYAIAPEASAAPRPSSPTPPAPQPSFFEPRGFVFGGFSYARDAQSGLKLNWLGAHGQIGGFVTDWLAIAGDVSFHFADVDIFGMNVADVDMLSFTAGPQFGNRHGKVRGFGHVFVGGMRVSASEFTGTIDESAVEFSSVIGGGVDVNLTDHFGIRVVEADWLRIWEGGGFDWIRLSFGVVGRF